MSIYTKLRDARRKFLFSGVEASGYNSHADFDYFELKDIIPVANDVFDEVGLFLHVTFDEGKCIGILTDLEEDASLKLEIPHAKIAEPAKFRMNEMQALGAELTYLRRYMYLVVLDIIQSDEIDFRKKDEAPSVKPDKKSTPKTKKEPEAKEEPKKESKAAPKLKIPPTETERSEIKKNLTNADGKADELQISRLQQLAMKWANLDQKAHDKATNLMVQTNGFADCTRKEADMLIDKITKAIESYGKKEEKA